MYFSTAINKDTGDSGESSESVSCDLGLGFSDFGQEGRFADGGEPNEGNASVWGWN